MFENNLLVYFSGNKSKLGFLRVKFKETFEIVSIKDEILQISHAPELIS